MNGKQLKNSILQWAIQGKLVPQDPNDEPASVLLEQIRAEKARLVKEKKIKKDKNESIIFRGDDNSHYEKFSDGTVKCIDDEIPFEIPESWEWCRMGEIITLLSGQDLTPDRYFDSECGIPYITGASHFVNGTLTISRWTKTPTSVAHKGDLLITCKGTVGTMAFNTIGDIHIARQVMAINTFFISLEFIKIFFEFVVPELEKQAHSIIPGISREVVLNTVFPLPPLAEQHRIIEKIEDLMPLVNQYSESQDKLNKLNEAINGQLKKSILQEAIQGKLVPQIAEEGDASELLKQIELEKQKLVKEGKLKKKDLVSSTIFRGDDNRYYEKVNGKIECIDEEIPFEIPESWEWVRLGDVIQISSGDGLTSKEMKNGNIPVYGGNGITGYHNDYNITEETVVIGRVGFYCGSVHVTPNKAWITDNAFITSYPKKSIYRPFLVLALKKMELGKVHNATAQPVVSGKKIYPLLFPLPPLAEQQRIVAKIEDLMPLVELCDKKKTNLVEFNV